MPVATGQLYVTDPKNKSQLRPESKCQNATETEEALVVQYLALGGHRDFSKLDVGRKPDRVASGIHAGPGQIVFGSGPTQRCDLMLAFFPDARKGDVDNGGSGSDVVRGVKLYFHNFHGIEWHYHGHKETCPKKAVYPTPIHRHKFKSAMLDRFRFSLASAFSKVSPKKVTFHYSFSTSCDYICAGRSIKSLQPRSTEVWYESLKELLLTDFPEGSVSDLPLWIPRKTLYLNKKVLTTKIADNKITGFVTLKGGRENPDFIFDRRSAAKNFGFCVQNYAPSPDEISPYTKRQIAEYFGWCSVSGGGGGGDDSIEYDLERVDNYIRNQPPRTLNSKTFHSEETVSTTYLRWLMLERGFVDFEITHFIEYSFSDFSKTFLEPVLQRRHEYKKSGNLVAAECLKLIGNGSFGYNGLESCNYDKIRLMVDVELVKARRRGLKHLSLKHVTMIGVVKSEIKARKKRNAKKLANDEAVDFFSNEAVEADDEEDDEAEEEDEEVDEDENFGLAAPAHFLSPDSDSSSSSSSSSDSENSDSDDSETDDLAVIDDVDFKMFRKKYLGIDDGGDDYGQGGSNDLDDMLVRSRERLKKSDHTYSKPPCKRMRIASSSSSSENSDAAVAAAAGTAAVDGEKKKKKKKKKKIGKKKDTNIVLKSKKKKYRYNFLYALSISGSDRPIKNTIQRAAAVLSNSKKLFFGHINIMLRCLDPSLAELSYIDTDSCLFSTTKEKLTDCLRPEKVGFFKMCKVVADEAADKSCHGQMKLEGTFQAARFKALKIYRLFSLSPNVDDDDDDADDEVALDVHTNHHNRFTHLKAVYTRCKGVNRYLATKLPDSAFDSFVQEKIIVHRSTLKPLRTGEMLIGHEARSLSVPFNLKRWTTDDGYHSFPISCVSENAAAGSDDVDEEESPL